jgi:hypothetical protein
MRSFPLSFYELHSLCQGMTSSHAEQAFILRKSGTKLFFTALPKA